MATDATAVTAPNHSEIKVTSDGVPAATGPSSDAPSGGCGRDEVAGDSPKPTGLHSPPDSNNAMKLDGSDDSELSDIDDSVIEGMQPPSAPQSTELPAIKEEKEEADGVQQKEEQEDIGEIVPDHWSGTVPVFRPTMFQFKDFTKFMEKVDSYGMKSGIIKIIPPDEWRQRQPPLDDIVKQVTVKQPIKQDIMGSNGTYRQVNILHQRSYNLPQWRQLCDQSEHQPPAKRGERRLNSDKPKTAPRPRAPASSTTAAKTPKSGGRRSTRGKGKAVAAQSSSEGPEDRPMTPVSPQPDDIIMESVEQDPGAEVDAADDTPRVGRMGAVKLPKDKVQSTSARRKYARREASARIDEEAFKDFDYRMDISDYTPERCEELERIYWKTLTYAQPLYGADMPGTLFNDETETWNLSKLPSLLDVLGTKIPGVNTAYLYLGMWKATFAWHLEDVDLYSINYLHFGAPKQWYSISQGDARRFEAAMKSIWPTDAQACDQFLRHKAFLISPNHLKQHFNIKVNKCVSYPGEFVVTYPYGYHSGYNLGYNCAEAVNFALDSWLPMGKIAKKCECAQAQDSVWIDVGEIERKLRGESTDYEETDDEEEDEEDEDEEDDEEPDSPTATRSVIKIRLAGRKRKRVGDDKGEKRKVKKIRLRVKQHVEPTCCLCPHDISGAEILPTEDGRKAHRICALYGPEVWVETVDGQEVIANTANISKARLDLKCLYCRSKRGICFQCSHKKCTRAYHATCAAAAGVLVEEAEVPLFGEDGTEYKEQAFAFTCRFHRTKRDKKIDVEALENSETTRVAAATLKQGDVCQLQYFRGDIFAGIIVENRADEETFLIDVIPNGDRVEVEWKWLLLPDPADLHLPKASPKAIPMPTSRKAKELINASKREQEELPRADEPFAEGYTWAEFKTYDPVNKAQSKVDFSKQDQLWHYLGKTSTEARAQYSEDPNVARHNPKSNFLDTIPRPPPTAVPPPSRHMPVSQPQPNTTSPIAVKPQKPYNYKPKPPTPTQAPAIPAQANPTPVPAVPAAATTTFTTQQFIPPAPVVPGPKHKSEPLTTSPTSQPAPQQSPSTNNMPSIPPPPPPSMMKPFATPKLKKPSSSKSGHTRNSLSLHNFGNSSKDKGHSRMRNYSFSFGSSFGFNKSDAKTSPFSLGFMQPPGLGASPSPQNGQLFQAQARARSNSTVSTKSFTTPMTSSAIRPSSSASNQSSAMHTRAPPTPVTASNSESVVTKYAFFQLNHNRDSSKYRTPYAPWGGFTNGYEGNLRAHLMKTPDALFGMKKDSISATPRGVMSAPGSTTISPFTPATPSRRSKSKKGLHKQSQSVSVFGSWDTEDFPMLTTDVLQSSSTQWGVGLNGTLPQVQRSNVAPRKSRMSQSAPSSSPMATINGHSRSKSTQVPLSNVFNTTKQTYVPPPRPWETLKKVESSMQSISPSASIPMPQFHGLNANGFSAPSPYSTLAANSPHSAMSNPFGSMMFGPSPFVHSGPSPTLPVMGSSMEGSPFGNDTDGLLGESTLEDTSEPSSVSGSFWPKFSGTSGMNSTSSLGHDAFPSSSMFGHDHFPSPPWNPY